MKKIFCFDLDGVICTTNKNDYKNSRPKKKNIIFINKLYDKGHFIKIFTARHMTTHKGNVSLVKKTGYTKTRSQLKKWKVKYHEFIMGKPSYDIFVDDKALGFKNNWAKQLKKIIKWKN